MASIVCSLLDQQEINELDSFPVIADGERSAFRSSSADTYLNEQDLRQSCGIRQWEVSDYSKCNCLLQKVSLFDIVVIPISSNV